MSELEKVARDHNLWCSIVAGFKCNPADVEDIVQEAYIKIHRILSNGKSISYGSGDINRLYVFRTLFSVFIDYSRSKKNSIFKEAPEYSFDYLEDNTEEYSTERDDYFNELWKEIMSEMKTWDSEGEYPYNMMVFMAYMTSDDSFTKLSNKTGIPRNSIVNTVRLRKEILTEKFGDKIEYFFNKF